MTSNENKEIKEIDIEEIKEKEERKEKISKYKVSNGEDIEEEKKSGGMLTEKLPRQQEPSFAIEDIAYRGIRTLRYKLEAVKRQDLDPQEKRQRCQQLLTEFRRLVIEQKLGIIASYNRLLGEIMQNKNTDRETLNAMIQETAQEYPLSTKARAELILGVDRYLQCNKEVKELAERYPEAESMFEHFSGGKKPEGKIEMIIAPFSITLICYSQKDYSYLEYFLANGHPPSEESKDSIGYGALSFASKNINIIYHGKESWADDVTRLCIDHENQHILWAIINKDKEPPEGKYIGMEFFPKSMLRGQEKKDMRQRIEKNFDLINYWEDYYFGRFANEVLALLHENELIKENITASEILSSQSHYYDYKKKGANFERYKEISGPYNFDKKLVDKVEQLKHNYDMDPEELNYFLEKEIPKSELERVNKLKAKEVIEEIREKFKRYTPQAVFKTIEQAAKAIELLAGKIRIKEGEERKFYNIDDIVAILTYEDIRKWPAIARRMVMIREQETFQDQEKRPVSHITSKSGEPGIEKGKIDKKELERKKFSWSGVFLGEKLSPVLVKEFLENCNNPDNIKKQAKEVTEDFKKNELEVNKTIAEIGKINKYGQPCLSGEGMARALGFITKGARNYFILEEKENGRNLLRNIEFRLLGQAGEFIEAEGKKEFILDREICKLKPGKIHHLRWLSELFKKEGEEDKANSIEEEIEKFVSQEFNNIGINYEEIKNISLKTLPEELQKKGVNSNKEEIRKICSYIYYNNLWPRPF